MSAHRTGRWTLGRDSDTPWAYGFLTGFASALGGGVIGVVLARVLGILS